MSTNISSDSSIGGTPSPVPPTTPKSRPADAAEPTAKAAAAAETEAEAEDEDGDDEESGSSLSRSLMYSASACAFSMVVHMVALIVMGLWLLPELHKDQLEEIVASVEERPDEVITQVLEEEIKPSKELALVSTAVSATMGAQGAVSALSQPQSVTEVVTNSPTSVQVDVGAVNVFASNGQQLSEALPEGQMGEAVAIADSYAEAMDRITQEILNKLAKGKLTVVWLMDESESMEDDREEIASRIDRVYQELGLSSSARGDALLTAVCGYGEKFNTYLPRPSSDTAQIMEAIRSVKNDPSGFEYQCQAMSQALAMYRGQTQGRQVMMIVVTDESGDPKSNVQYLESVIAEAKSMKCSIYFLGREAVFGYPYAYMTWRDPEKPQFGTYYLQIDRGPETPMPEQLQWEGFRRRNDAHPSGFGPYEQARIARQTGGVFFMLPSPEVRLLHRDNRKYALEALRPYLPDLSARTDYIAERDKSDFRGVQWKIIADLNPWNTQVARQLEPRMTFPIERPEFTRAAQQSMDQARMIITYLQMAEDALEKVKPLRARESSPRWRANFDLIYGQVLAYQVRMFEYGAYLDAFVKQPKPIKNTLGPTRPTNRWHMAHRKETITDEVTKEKRDMAEMTFRQILIEHAGTPYATRAQYELNRNFGMQLNEGHENPYRPPPGVSAPKPPKL